eukprot:TRINITY_DN5248_c0_g1_i1.p1 TRINITY_DN5248_c0_g1~~TRINITY_DN5248_c0_g1_i1.p1  ORF type:complete len:379 (-),score=55.13 TRINITY_DN5248_c0_g1_i1:115-1251(-)
MVKLRFLLNHTTLDGSIVHVCGNVVELGNWDVRRAPRATLTVAGFWSLEVVVRTTGVLEYKYIVRNPQTGNVRWEEGSNRPLAVLGDLDDVWVLQDAWRYVHTSVPIRVYQPPPSQPSPPSSPDVPEVSQHHHPELVPSRGRPNLFDTVAPLCNNERLSDVVFFVGEHREPFYGHRLVLAARSKEFERMLFAEKLPVGTDGRAEFEFPDLKEETFSHILSYCYRDEVKLTPNNVMDVNRAAEMFRLEPLMWSCGHYIAKEMGTLGSPYGTPPSADLQTGTTTSRVGRLRTGDEAAATRGDTFIRVSPAKTMEEQWGHHAARSCSNSPCNSPRARLNSPPSSPSEDDAYWRTGPHHGSWVQAPLSSPMGCSPPICRTPS